MARRHHLIDIENLAYDPLDRYEVARARLQHYLDAAWRPGDLVTIASNPRLWNRLAWDIPVQHRYVLAPKGQDGADRALLACAEELDTSALEGLWIGSGDHIFADVAERYAASGLQVGVVANRGAIADSLKKVAHIVHELPPVGLSGRREARAHRPSTAAQRLPRRRQHSFTTQPTEPPHRARTHRNTPRRTTATNRTRHHQTQPPVPTPHQENQ